MKKVVISLFCVLLLTSCVTRQQADERLLKGCMAAVGLFLEDGYKIKKIKRSVYKDAIDFGSGYREVMLFAVESDGWVDLDKEYSCIFAEEFNAMGSTHRANIYQVKVNGNVYGREGNNILGDMDTHIKLSKTVEDAMR